MMETAQNMARTLMKKIWSNYKIQAIREMVQLMNHIRKDTISTHRTFHTVLSSHINTDKFKIKQIITWVRKAEEQMAQG